MGDSPGKVVWVLGAGFSAPVGGPLLDSLFTAARIKTVGQRVPSLSASAAAVREVYRLDGLDEKQRRTIDYKWGDPEEFLECVDLAARVDGPKDIRESVAAAVGRVPYFKQGPEGTMLSRLRLETRRVLAALCGDAFLDSRSVIEATERWVPYQEWAAQLRRPLDDGGQGGDTVITFNYDCVAELVAGDTVKTPLPGEVDRLEDDAVPLLKLHGSVGWLWGKCDTILRVDPRLSMDQLVRMNLKDGSQWVPAIVGPGRDKIETVSSHFKDIWTRAERALEEADVVVFVGYRFPETDAQAKRRLLGALMRNARQRLDLHIVLGPDQDRHVRRLQGMLEWVRRRTLADAQIHMQPMYSQDFMTVFTRALLGTS